MRIANRLVAFVVAIALLALGIIVIIEVIAARSSSAPITGWHSILRWGERNTWKASSVELASAITAAIGLLLLLPQLRRRRPSRLRVKSPGATDAALTRKGVAVTVRGAVGEVEGISGSAVKVGHRRIRVNATSAAHDGAVARELTPAVQAAATKQLDALQLTPNPRLKVAVSSRQGRS